MMTLNQQDRSCSEDAPRARQIDGTVNSDDIGSANSIQTNSRFVMSIRRFIFLKKKRNVVRFQICLKKKKLWNAPTVNWWFFSFTERSSDDVADSCLTIIICFFWKISFFNKKKGKFASLFFFVGQTKIPPIYDFWVIGRGKWFC